MAYANNKGADQPAHPRSLISTIVVRYLDSMICILALFKVPRFMFVSLAEQAGLNLTWSKIPKDTFSRDVAHVWLCKKYNGEWRGTITRSREKKSSQAIISRVCTRERKEQWAEPRHDKTNKMSVRRAKTQISLGIPPVWSVFAVRSVGS